MQLNQFNDKSLTSLLRQSQQWLALDKLVKQNVPVNLHAHFKVVCVEQGVLIVYAYHAMAAARLNLLKTALLQQLNSQGSLNIHNIRITQHPKQETLQKRKEFHIPQQALTQFAQTARKVSHHQSLSEALDNLVKHHQA
ncbi:DciA family protein [Neisseriaceae bacterium B1]